MSAAPDVYQQEIQRKAMLKENLWPKRWHKLPRNDAGWPIMFFVAKVPETGKYDLRVQDPEKWMRAVKFNLCWICGEPVGRHKAYVIGPMCAVNRTTSEPACHTECGDAAARICPFLTRPKMHRVTSTLPAGVKDAPGIGLDRNPGVALVWIQREPAKVFMTSTGPLLRLGDPSETRWYCEARPATRPEILHSINTGLPFLREQCDHDGPEAHAELDRFLDRAMRYLPAA